MRRLESYEFPGNVRELENIIERAVALSSSMLIGLSDLPEVKASRLAPRSCRRWCPPKVSISISW